MSPRKHEVPTDHSYSAGTEQRAGFARLRYIQSPPERHRGGSPLSKHTSSNATVAMTSPA